MVDGLRVYGIDSDGSWYTPVDLDMEDGGKKLSRLQGRIKLQLTIVIDNLLPQTQSTSSSNKTAELETSKSLEFTLDL